MQISEVLKEVERYFSPEKPRFYVDLNSKGLDLYEITYRERTFRIQNISNGVFYSLNGDRVPQRQGVVQIPENIDLEPLKLKITIRGLRKKRRIRSKSRLEKAAQS